MEAIKAPLAQAQVDGARTAVGGNTAGLAPRAGDGPSALTMDGAGPGGARK